VEDKQAFAEHEFVAMFSSILHGLASSMGLLMELPGSPKRLDLGAVCFKQVVEAAANRMAFFSAQSLMASASVSSEMIRDWLSGAPGDPLAAPLALLLHRFSDKSATVEDEKLIRLSHTRPVALPQSPASTDAEAARKTKEGRLRALQERLGGSRQMLKKFERYAALPVLPAAHWQNCLQEFEELQRRSAETATDSSQHVFADAAKVDPETFVIATCPFYFRPKISAKLDEIVGKLLWRKVTQEAELLSAERNTPGTAPAPPQKFVKPLVSESDWRDWHDSFDALDASASGHLSSEQLKKTGLMAPEICDYLCKSIARERSSKEEAGFSKVEFVIMMCDVSGSRPRSPLM